MAFPSGTKSDLEKADYQDYADLEQEERDLELKLVQLQVVEGLQAGGMSDDDEASEAGAAIEISHSPTQGRRIRSSFSIEPPHPGIPPIRAPPDNKG
jgi:hypothetical protein